MNHHPKNTAPEAQAVLPHVRITVTDTGALDVTMDGAAFPPPAHGEWSRERFGELLDAVTHDRTIAVRVEVREVDGAVFTDLIEPAKPVRRPTLDLPTEPDDTSRSESESSPLVEVSADGFISGEDVALALIVSHTTATGGTARALVDPAQLIPGGSAREVLLFGRVSGTLHVEALP